ncbi:Ldh family oxidoreductase [Aurantimonas sp. MSK8Z-1]|uniref:Ldh family oxidoreductase n=1 Tax=Mangrovibrevibacter kandeliae TaxID=2968473 RepID=UPI0021174C7E|nr:Ldh family oxidoreductase [Aurantimonas sp. MSK8Z-1]MCW4116093.1 Ldh family oxidoreductase [Aurantimonas sp. MSK8Z-1]
MERDGLRLAYPDLVERIRPIFERNGCSPGVARLLAENCAAAERDGAHSHGLFRLKGYVSTLNADGWVDGRAVPKVEDAAPGFLRIDGRNGFTVPALAAGRALAVEKTRANGVCILAIRNSHHLGALSLDVEPFAEEGLVALAFINSMRAVVPHGGRRAVFGTNPIAFASPRAKGLPFVFDQATSVMANGDVQIAAREGRALPPGTGIDRNGEPTTHPKALLDGGALNAFGGYKGATLAMMVEILCAALVGGKFSHEVDLAAHPGAATPHTGQSFILIDPACGRGALPGFAERVEELIAEIHAAGQERLPGDRRHAARETSERAGILVGREMLAAIDAMAAG